MSHLEELKKRRTFGIITPKTNDNRLELDLNTGEKML